MRGEMETKTAIRPACPQCGGHQVLYRVRKREHWCRVCGITFKFEEGRESSVGAEPRRADNTVSVRDGKASRKHSSRGHVASDRKPSAAMPTAPYPPKKAPDPNFRRKCERGTCRHEKVYHVHGLCQLCDGGTSLHEFQEAEE